MSRLRFLAIAALALLAVVGLSACGADKSKVERFAENEGVYFDVGALTYQVQITRTLNPADAEDSELMQGVPPAVIAAKQPGDEWLATFLRVENQGDDPQKMATQIFVRDTNGDIYRPIPMNPAANAWVYRPIVALAPQILQPGSTYPNINSLPGQIDINGKMLLFKVPVHALRFRPLEMTIVDSQDKTESGVVNLDI